LREYLACGGKKQSVSAAEVGASHLTAHDVKLMPQHQDFQLAPLLRSPNNVTKDQAEKAVRERHKQPSSSDPLAEPKLLILLTRRNPSL
jgi:hypothetical protein